MLVVETEGSKREMTLLKLTAGYETNLEVNAKRKDARYNDLITRLQNEYDAIRFFNLSMSCLGFYWSICSKLDEMMKVLDLTDNIRTFYSRE